MKLDKQNSFQFFEQATDAGEKAALKTFMDEGNYSHFSVIVNQMRERIRHADEQQLDKLSGLIDKGEQIFPEPEKYSPSWDGLWQDYRTLVDYKASVLRSVPEQDRDGEWQVLMDNPFTTEGIVCYTSLGFLEAAYMFAYFRQGLQKTEHLRLQKVVNKLVYQGI